MNFARLKGNPANCCYSTRAISAFVYFAGSVLKKTNRLGRRSFDSISFRATARRSDAFSIWLARKNENICLFFPWKHHKVLSKFSSTDLQKKKKKKCGFISAIFSVFIYLLTHWTNVWCSVGLRVSNRERQSLGNVSSRREEAKDSFVGSSVRVVDVCTEALLCWWRWVSWSQCECSSADVRKYLRSVTVGRRRSRWNRGSYWSQRDTAEEPWVR